MKYLVTLLLLVSNLALAGGIDDRCSQFVVWGAPVVAKSDLVVCHTGYALEYDNQTRVAKYVVERISKFSLGGTAGRNNDFREDPDVPAAVRSTLKDYTASGYDRGHMAPAADFTVDALVMSESFFLSNMMPQNPGNNRGIWKYLEEQTRNIAAKNGDVYVITGTIFDANPKKIGGTSVPSKVYKIVIDPKTGKTLAHVFPNIKLPVTDIDKYAVTVADIEKQTGINFSPRVPVGLNKENIKTTLKDW